jgi:signal transduction histidine kinase
MVDNYAVSAPETIDALGRVAEYEVLGSREGLRGRGPAIAVNSKWLRLLEATRRKPKQTDYAIAAVFVMTMIVSLWAGWKISSAVERDSIRWYANIAASCAVAVLVLRRRYPELQLFLTTCLFFIGAFGNAPDGFVGVIAVWVSMYGVGAYGGRYRTMARTGAVVLISALFLWLLSKDGANGDIANAPEAAYTSAVILAFLASAWLFGDTMRIRRQQEVDLRTRALELEMERDLNAGRAVTEERLRIARELHDVMAHHVTVISMQAAAADRVLERDPAMAHRALVSIGDASRSTIDELQRLLGFLRTDTGAAGGTDAPQPSIATLSALIEENAAAGLSVTLELNGPIAALPSSVSLSAYRIIQEGLTNVRRHAPLSPATVRVDIGTTNVTLSVENGPQKLSNTKRVTQNDASSRPVVRGTGHGLVGMRERARLVGGDVSAKPTSNGGWRVEATLPLKAVPLS